MQRAVRGSNHNLVAVCTTARPSIKAAAAAAAAAALLTMTGGTVAAKSLLTGVEESQLRLNNMAFSNPRLQPSIVILAEAPATPSWPAAPLGGQLMLSRALVLAPPLFVYSRMDGPPRAVACYCRVYPLTAGHPIWSPFPSRLVKCHSTVCARFPLDRQPAATSGSGPGQRHGGPRRSRAHHCPV
jgi:hypothetical protein